QEQGLTVLGEDRPPQEVEGRKLALQKLVNDLVDGAQSQWWVCHGGAGSWADAAPARPGASSRCSCSSRCCTTVSTSARCTSGITVCWTKCRLRRSSPPRWTTAPSAAASRRRRRTSVSRTRPR